MSELVCAIDLGSSAVKAALVDREGVLAAEAVTPAPHVEGGSGRFDAGKYAWAVVDSLGQLAQKLPGAGARVAGISFSSQRATLVLPGGTGAAISWQGSDCAAAADRFYAGFGPDRFHHITGLPPSFLYTVAKLAHLKEEGHLAGPLLTLHELVAARLGASRSLIDPSNASATGLFDIAAGGWSGEVLDHLGLRAGELPEVAPAGTPMGELGADVAASTGLREGIPLFTGGGDQQCAALGAVSSAPGKVLLSLGTAGVAICALDRLPEDRSGGVLLLAGVPQDRWQAEGFVNAFGSCVPWLGDIMGFDSPAGLEELAAKAEGAGPVFVPFIAGAGTPDQNPYARGAFMGLGAGDGRAQMARALVNGLACECRRVVESLSRMVPVQGLVLVGGGGGSTGLMRQLLADTVGVPVEIAADREASLRGAAALAWSALDGGAPDGIFGDARTEEVAASSRAREMEAVYERYTRAVAAVLSLAGDRDG